MPRKRLVKKGSFGSHFDEIVKKFPNDHAKPSEDGEKEPDSIDPRNVNDRLFESASRREPQRGRPA